MVDGAGGANSLFEGLNNLLRELHLIGDGKKYTHRKWAGTSRNNSLSIKLNRLAGELNTLIHTHTSLLFVYKRRQLSIVGQLDLVLFVYNGTRQFNSNSIQMPLLLRMPLFKSALFYTSTKNCVWIV